MESTIVQWRAAGWSDACIGEAIRDDPEAIEVCSINIELLNRMGSFDDEAIRDDPEAIEVCSINIELLNRMGFVR